MTTPAAVPFTQAPVEPTHPWDAIVAALDTFYLRALGLPEQASTLAPAIDRLHFFQITVMFAVAGVIAVVTLAFVVHYRRRTADQVGRRVEVPRSFELGIYSGLFALFMLFWVVGFRQFAGLERPPGDAIEVYVTSSQWVWKFTYADGPASVGVLYVPVGRPVRLRLTSRDVIHSFFVPAFRIKRDAVPGTYTAIWFQATQPGRYPILCAELCGVGHSRMRAEVIVLAPRDFDDWLRGRPPAGPVGPVGPAGPVGAPGVAGVPGAVGAADTAGAAEMAGPAPYEDRASGLGPLSGLAALGRAAAARHGCLQCHSIDGRTLDGPTWRDLYGARETLRSGEVVSVTPAYITQSMMDPMARIVAGFEPIMPSYQGRITPAETAAIIEYMKALSPSPGLRRGREGAVGTGADAVPGGAMGDTLGGATGDTLGAPPADTAGRQEAP